MSIVALIRDARQTRRSPSKRCSDERPMSGRSTARNSRLTQRRSRRRIRQSQKDEYVLPSMRQDGGSNFRRCCRFTTGGANSMTCSSNQSGRDGALVAFSSTTSRPEHTPRGASYIDVIANPNALGFYTRLGFHVTHETSTRFGAAPRMTLALPQHGSDEAAIADLMSRFLRTVSFEQGEQPNYGNLATLFIPAARLIRNSDQPAKDEARHTRRASMSVQRDAANLARVAS
jgi:hypothetical protein